MNLRAGAVLLECLFIPALEQQVGISIFKLGLRSAFSDIDFNTMTIRYRHLLLSGSRASVGRSSFKGAPP